MLRYKRKIIYVSIALFLIMNAVAAFLLGDVAGVVRRAHQLQQPHIAAGKSDQPDARKPRDARVRRQRLRDRAPERNDLHALRR